MTDPFVFLPFPMHLPKNIVGVWCEMPMSDSRLVLQERQHLASELCAQKLCAHFGVERQPGHNAFGKPCMPEGYHLSITHKNTQTFAVMAKVNATAFLGVDCEALVENDLAKKLERRICTAEEKTWLQTTSLGFAKGITLLFSAKEASFKALPDAEQKQMRFRDMQVDPVAQSVHIHSGEIRLTLRLQVHFLQNFVLTLVWA